MVLPLCCLANVFWYACWVNAEGARIEAHENYSKQSYRNRFEIYGANGMLALTVPVPGQSGEKVPIQQMRVDGDAWKVLVKRSLRSAYNSSPYFEHYGPDLEQVIDQAPISLWELNIQLHMLVCRWLGIDDSLQLTSEFEGLVPEVVKQSKPAKQHYENPRYTQVFEERHGFKANLSVVDLVFNLGPESLGYLKSLGIPAEMRTYLQ